jgi:hypothetical protein
MCLLRGGAVTQDRLQICSLTRHLEIFDLRDLLGPGDDYVAPRLHFAQREQRSSIVVEMA